MNDPQQSFYRADSSDNRDALNPALRDALRSLSTGSSGTGSNLTPAQISELAMQLAQKGGASTADIARLSSGLGAGTTDVSGQVGPQSVICSIGDIACAFPGESVQGIERLSDIAHVPNTASWVLGVVQLRGVIYSVVDLSAFLGLTPSTITNRSRLLIISLRGMTIGMVVDAVLELRGDMPVQQGASGQSLTQWIAPYSAGVVEMGGRQVQLIDVQRLVFAGKMQRYGADAG